LSALLVFLLGCLFNTGVEARPNGILEFSESDNRKERNVQLPDLSGSTIVGGSHNFGTKTFTQTTQNNINDGSQPNLSTTTTTTKEQPLLSANGLPLTQNIQTITHHGPDMYIKKCFYERVPQNHIRIINSNGSPTFFVNRDANAPGQFITESDGTTISQSSQGQIIKTPTTTVYQGNLGKMKRSPATFGYQGSTQIYNGGSKFQGGSHNFGSESYHQNQHFFENTGTFRPITTTTSFQEPGTYIEKCYYEKILNPGQIPSTTVIQKNLGREKRSPQNFGNSNSPPNYGGSHYQGGAHNFGTQNVQNRVQNIQGNHFEGGQHNFGQQSYTHNYRGSHFQGGQHNLGQQSYNQNRWGSTGQWF